MIDLGLLGSTVLTGADGRELSEILSRPKRLALLTFLAVERPGALHRRDKLAALLWERSDETRARSSLSVTLHHLKRILGEDVIVKRGTGEIGVSLEGLRVDVNEFLRRLEAGELHLAAELYRGPMLEGFHLADAPAFTRWLEGKRRRLHLGAIDAHIKLADGAMEEEPEVAARWARRATTLAPYDEAAHGRVVEALARMGHRADALGVFERFEARLREEVELEPSQELRRLVERLRSSTEEPEAPPMDDGSSRPAPDGAGRRGSRTTSQKARLAFVVSMSVIAVSILLSAIVSGRDGGSGEIPGGALMGDLLESDGSSEPVAAEIRSAAVLLPAAVSGSEREGYVAKAVHDLLLAEMEKVEDFHGVSGGSVESDEVDATNVSQLAAELGVDAVVGGSVLYADGRIDVTVDVLRGATGGLLWSDRFRAPIGRIAALQEEIVRSIVDRLRPGIDDDGRGVVSVRPIAPEAVEHYLMGSFYLGQQTKEGFQRAVASYQRAIAIDSAYAPAHAGLAMAYVELGSWHSSLPPRAVHADALTAANRAVALDSTVAEGHIALGRIRYLFEWDWEAAGEAFRRGMEAGPTVAYSLSAYGSYLMAMGRFEEAVEVFERRVARDPLSQAAHDWLGWALDEAGRPEEAYLTFLAALELPDQGWSSEVLVAEHHFRRGERDAARRYLLEGSEALDEGMSPSAMALAAHLLGRLGHVREATDLLEKLQSRRRSQWVPPTSLAVAHMGLGQTREALALIEAGVDQRDVMCVWLATWWVFDPLRGEPRFQAVMERMGFPGG